MESSSRDDFEAFFMMADLDGDGQISEAEAVAFFEGFSLPYHVVAQVWRYADRRESGYLVRQEFYNALKLVTIAQTRMELTPEIVNVALRSRVSSPQINVAATLSHGVDTESLLNREASAEPDARIGTSSQQASTDPPQDLLRIVGSVDVEASRRRSTNSSSHDEANAIVLRQDAESSPSPGALDQRTEQLFDHLKQAMAEAMKSRWKAERDAVEAIHKAEALESLYAEETRQRKEIEEMLSKEKEELENLKNDKDGIIEKLQNALIQTSAEKELQQKIIFAVELMEAYKKERDDALKEAEELRKSRAEASSSGQQPQFFFEFSLSEIKEATNNFDPSLMIGEGGYGSVYKGVLHHTPVTIKMLHSSSMQGPSEFQQEVAVLSKVRHPYVVTLIGACPEVWALVYEYLPNGSLEDRLSCRDNSPPLTWQTRIRIATELCSALIFLHSNKQYCIVHDDLKPDKILLDANLVSKLSDFGNCPLLERCGSSGNNTRFRQIGGKFTLGGASPKLDVCGFGMILLRLLTGRSPLTMMRDVQRALDIDALKDVLDPLAGDWPFLLAKRLAHLALRCCHISWKHRPDLASEIWRVLEPMKASCGGSPCYSHGSDESPSYFICPIFQEVMQDPQFAADGFTYEAEALRGWFESGHDTSPMTNLKLEHCNLVPNRALRSAIQESLPQQNP